MLQIEAVSSGIECEESESIGLITHAELLEIIMAKQTAKFSFSNLADYRKSQGMNQTDFWKRLGITQSGGSRYEAGRNVPNPVKLLLALAELGIVTDETLDKARKLIAKSN